MNAFGSCLRRSFDELWDAGYGDEVRRAAVVAPVLTVVGFAAAWFFPQVSENLLRFFSMSVDVEGISAGGQNAASLIFLNNSTAAFSALLWGLVPFAYLAALPLGFNFFVLGVMGAYAVQSGMGLGAYLAGILPHGLFELPALVLFCAAGLYLCSRVTARVRGDKSVKLLPLLSALSRLYLCVLLPLLAVSALMEAYVTPWLLSAVL